MNDNRAESQLGLAREIEQIYPQRSLTYLSEPRAELIRLRDTDGLSVVIAACLGEFDEVIYEQMRAAVREAEDLGTELKAVRFVDLSIEFMRPFTPIDDPVEARKA